MNLYTYWSMFCFILSFTLVYPFLWLALQKKEWHSWNGFLYKVVGKMFYTAIGVKVKSEWEFEPDPNQNYIYAANHTSYLDISAMIMTIPKFSIFMGKAEAGKVPFFGYIFRKAHISVSRDKSSSRSQAFEDVKKVLREGKNVLIYPEGGIFSKTPPDLCPFKDGAFRAAIQTQTPLVPVTILYNWIIFPDKQPFKFSRHDCKLIYHKPIQTENLTIKDVEKIKEQTYQTIDSTLKKYTA